ncbi:protein NTM1-like 9 [Fagus crenata]
MESLMVGLKFAPTDEELIGHYLRLKNDGRASEVQVIPEVDFYKYEPWRLPKIFPLPITSTSILSCDGAYIFFCQRDGNYKNTFRDNNIRATSSGYWKAFSKDRHIRSRKLGTNNTSLTATKKILVFYLGHVRGVRTEWVMHEFCATDPRQDDFVLCRLFRFPIAFPTAGGPRRFAEADLFLVHELGLISNTDEPDSFWSPKHKGINQWLIDKLDNMAPNYVMHIY